MFSSLQSIRQSLFGTDEEYLKECQLLAFENFANLFKKQKLANKKRAQDKIVQIAVNHKNSRDTIYWDPSIPNEEVIFSTENDNFMGLTDTTSN